MKWIGSNKQHQRTMGRHARQETKIPSLVGKWSWQQPASSFFSAFDSCQQWKISPIFIFIVHFFAREAKLFFRVKGGKCYLFLHRHIFFPFCSDSVLSFVWRNNKESNTYKQVTNKPFTGGRRIEYLGFNAWTLGLLWVQHIKVLNRAG
jgi:hypothetical protein